jgi:hypothetical protein
MLSMNKIFSIIILFQVSVFTNAQIPQQTILTGKTSKEQFGRNVKISADGKILAVGAPLSSEHGDKAGRIVLYKSFNNSWLQMGNEILPGEKDFRYGEMMELSDDGKKIIVASPFGGISFYTLDSQSWGKSPQTIQLENNYDQIMSLSITPDAQNLAVSFDCVKHKTVCIKLFTLNGKQWVQDGADIVPYPDEKIYSLSLSLSADGRFLVAGNYSKDVNTQKNAGEVIIYNKKDNQWLQDKQYFRGEASNANLGSSVVISKNGNWIIAASNSMDLFNQVAGFAETYEKINNRWVKDFKPLKPEKQNSYFSYSISISADGDILALSMPYIGYGKPGYVKVYKNTLSGWKEIAKIIDINGIETTSSPNNSTGWSIALSADGTTLAVGFPHNDENGDMSGKVVVYDLSNIDL